MAARSLEFEVARKGRPVDGGRFNAVADLDDIDGLRSILRGWLDDTGWSGRSSEFEMRVRPAGAWRFKTTVRA
jgi:hypothetical protein